MATFTAVWVPNTEPGASAGGVLAANTGTGPIFIGKRRIFRIWTSSTWNMNIAFGNSTIAAPGPNSYAIGPVPQEFDTGDESQYIHIMNNNTSVASYYYQVMNKF